MNICEVCDRQFQGKQSWATICPRCAKEISDYRAGLWKAKEVTGGQESCDQTKAKYKEYYRKNNKPRKCVICGKEFYVKGASKFCDVHRTEYSMNLEAIAGKRWTKTTVSDIIKVMKQQYKNRFKSETVVTEVIQPLSGFDRKIIQLGKC